MTASLRILSSKADSNTCFVTKYSSLANPIKRIIHSNWNLIKSDPVLREVFSAPPKISFNRAPTLRDRLVPSHLPAKKTDYLASQTVKRYLQMWLVQSLFQH